LTVFPGIAPWHWLNLRSTVSVINASNGRK